MGPEMVLIEAGRFLMGSPEDETDRDANEGPQHPVTVVRPFALARCETTVGEFRAFAEDTGYETDAERGEGCRIWNKDQTNVELKKDTSWRAPGFEQSESHPVVCVSWNDALAYAAWLSEQTGQHYRLPSESEWEYAARAGTETAFWSGECIHTDQANYAGIVDYNDCGANTGVYLQATVAVGTLSANPWGLHDTAGNVWEWVQDCWHEDYTDAPAEGSAWEEPGCARRVVRGGGWGSYPEDLRSANRGRDAPGEANNFVGIRLARAL